MMTDLTEAYEEIDRRMQVEAAALRQEHQALDVALDMLMARLDALIAHEREFFAQWRAETAAIAAKTKE